MAKRVLVLKPSSFGDIIHTLPAVAWIKKSRPDWQLSWLINTEWAPLLAGNATLESTVLFPRREFRGAFGVGRFWRWVQQEGLLGRPDITVDFQGLLRTALIGTWSKAKFRYGLDDAREGAQWFYTHKAVSPPGIPHAVERYLALAREILEESESNLSKLDFPLPNGLCPGDPDEFASDGYVLLHPFSRGHGKSLTPWQVEQICQRVAPHKQIVLVGRNPGRHTLALPVGSVDFLDRTNLDGLIWLMRRAAFVISVDSGPMHLAAALDRPLVSIHTWSDPRKVGPYRPAAWVWKSGRLFRFSQRYEQEEDVYREQFTQLRSADLDALSALAIDSS